MPRSLKILWNWTIQFLSISTGCQYYKSVPHITAYFLVQSQAHWYLSPYLARVPEYFNKDGGEEDTHGLEQVAQHMDQSCSHVQMLLASWTCTVCQRSIKIFLTLLFKAKTKNSHALGEGTTKKIRFFHRGIRKDRLSHEVSGSGSLNVLF